MFNKGKKSTYQHNLLLLKPEVRARDQISHMAAQKVQVAEKLIPVLYISAIYLSLETRISALPAMNHPQVLTP